MNLQKRLLSSVEAFHRTLSVHGRALGVSDPAEERQGQSEVLAEDYGPSDDDLEEALDQETASETKGWEPPVEARALLEATLAPFKQGFETGDLRAAHQLLSEL